MKVGNTEYEWEGLIDNAIRGLDQSTFSWTKNMIKQHFPELKKQYEKGQEALEIYDQIGPIINIANHENGKYCMELIQSIYDRNRMGKEEYDKLPKVIDRMNYLKKVLKL